MLKPHRQVIQAEVNVLLIGLHVDTELLVAWLREVVLLNALSGLLEVQGCFCVKND